MAVHRPPFVMRLPGDRRRRDRRGSARGCLPPRDRPPLRTGPRQPPARSPSSTAAGSASPRRLLHQLLRAPPAVAGAAAIPRSNAFTCSCTSRGPPASRAPPPHRSGATADLAPRQHLRHRAASRRARSGVGARSHRVRSRPRAPTGFPPAPTSAAQQLRPDLLAHRVRCFTRSARSRARSRSSTSTGCFGCRCRKIRGTTRSASARPSASRGSSQGQQLARAVRLLRVDREGREATVQQPVHHRAVEPGSAPLLSRSQERSWAMPLPPWEKEASPRSTPAASVR